MTRDDSENYLMELLRYLLLLMDEDKVIIIHDTCILSVSVM